MNGNRKGEMVQRFQGVWIHRAVDKEGIHPCYVGDLPPQLAALNQSNVNVQELAVQGIAEKDKTKIFHSILLDPITAAMLTIDETRRMVDELFSGDKPFLKGYK